MKYKKNVLSCVKIIPVPKLSKSYAYQQRTIVPLNKGIDRQMVIGPRLANWPKESSRKNNGIPTSSCIIQYGIRNAPAKKKKKKKD